MTARDDQVGIALGSNLGDRAERLRQALRAIIDQGVVTDAAASSIYETLPVGEHAGGLFLNAVVVGRSTRPPRELLACCMRIEQSLGRMRGKEEPGGPRSIDLDLLFVGRREVSEAGLTLPHPRMFGRAFVLKPLSELAADLVLPTAGKSVHSLLESLDPKAIVRRVGPLQPAS